MAAVPGKKGDGLQRIVDALGGIRLVAVECNVSTWTVRAWIEGTRAPSPTSQRRLNAIAEDLGLRLPYPKWASGVRQRDPEARVENVSQRLRLELTRAERSFGFAHLVMQAHVCAAATLRPGLFAVKVVTDDGAAEYAICDDALRPLYRPAANLRELQRRFSRA
ncbi:MAG TPA: hypothetical protein VF765_17895 [Polyangiaceae bacterium]